MAEENNLGNLNATVSLTPDTTAVERAIADMTSKAKRQFDELGGQTLTQLTQNFNGLTNAVTGGLDAINSGIAKIRNVASLGFLGGGVAGIINQIFQTRSYFQDAASSMKTFLGDADKAAKFTKELQEYAFYNMYEFQDLVGVSKQLIAYGTKDTKEIIQVTDQLSNIASGTGANIYEMVDIFNKIKARGTADGQVLQQLASRGLVVKDVLQQMGETVNGNKVTFEQFQKVLAHVTGEGGMFHDLMKEQLNNLSASAAQLSDVMTNMWNEIGEQAEPYMKEAIDLAAMVVENYKEIAAVLFEVAKAYGIYKVAASAIEWNKQSKAEEHIKRLEEEKTALEEAAEATKNVGNEDLQAQVKKKRLTQEEANEIAQLRKQVAEENKARIAKGDLTKEEAKKIAVVKEGLKIREIELKKMQEQAAKEVATINEEIAALEKRNKLAQSKVSLSPSTGGNAAAIAAETDAMRLKELQSRRTAAVEREAAAAQGIATIQTARSTAANAANATSKNILARAATAAGSALKGIGSSIVSMINPMGMLIAAVGYLVEALIEAKVQGSATEQAIKRLDKAQDDATENINREKTKLAEIAETLKTANKETQEYKDAKMQLIEMSKQYNVATDETVDGVKKEMDAIDLITQKYDEYQKKIEEVYNRKAYEAFVADEKEGIIQKAKEVTSTIREQMSKALLDGIEDPDEKGMIMARINAAVAEINLKMQQGLISGSMSSATGINIQGLSKETDAIFNMYLDKMGLGQEMLNSLKGGWQTLMDWVSGDITFDEGEAAKSGKDYAKYLIATGMKDIRARLSAIKSADLVFGINGKQKEEGGGEDGETPQSPKVAIKKAKEEAKKYIQEYAKIMADFRKKKHAIDTDASLDDEERASKISALERDFEKELDKLEVSISEKTLSVATREKLRKKYMYAATEEYDAAYEAYMKKQKEITELQAKANNLQLSGSKDKNGNAIDTQANTATYNNIVARIAELTAELEGYNEVISRTSEWEKNYKRIREITKGQNDKFLADEIRKQREIRETYEKLRREIMLMYDDEQLTDEQYRDLSFQLDINEERERQQEYINIYGGYYVKREQLMREWEQRLANVPPEYFNVAKRQMVEELSKMDFSQFKENLNWDAIFGDLSKQTAKTLAQNLDDLQAAFNAQKGSMGIEEIKTVQEAIGKLNDELAKRNPWKAMFQAAKDLKAAQANIPALEEKQAKARQKLAVAQSNYDYALAERQRIEDNVAAGIMTQEQAAQELVSVNGNLAAATKELNDAEVQLKNTDDELNAENEKATKAQLRLGEGWKQVGGYISEAGSALSKIGDALGEDGEKLKEIGDVMSTVGSTLTQTIQSLGNPTQAISQAINATVQMITNVIASRRKARKEQEDWAKAQRDFITNMNLAEIESTRLRTKDSGNWVRDYLSEAKDAAEAYTKAQSKLYDKMLEISEKGKAKLGMREKLDWGTVGKNTALGAGAGAAIGSIIPGVGTAIGAAVGAIVGTVGGFISGLFSKKNKKIWGDLMTQFPELVETAANGEERINVELADQLIEQGMINDETKELIEDAKKYQEEMDAARKQIEEIADSLMGSLGNNLRSALVDAFTEGTDAAEALHKTVNATLEDMVSQLLYGARLAPIFEKIKTAMADSLQYGGGALDMIDIISDNYAELQAASEQMTNDLQTVQEYAEKKGWDLFKGEAAERNAVSGGIANVTQDTAEEMNGRLTQIQSHTYSINENMRLMVNMQTTQLAILQGIHTDTGQLHAIRASIANLESTVSDIQIRGVKLKA